MRKRIFAVFTATILLTSLLTGCGAENTTTPLTESNDTNIIEDVESAEEPSNTETEDTAETIEPTEEPTEEVIAEPTEEIEKPEEPEEPTFTYTDLNATMYAKSSVNVRDLPDTSGNKLGGLSKAQEITVTGQCNETSWYRIEYKGGVGYVSNSYLVKDKPAEQVAQQPAEKTNDASLNTNQNVEYAGYDEFGNGYTLDANGDKVFNVNCPYAINQPVDDGEKTIYYYGYLGKPALDSELAYTLESRNGTVANNTHFDIVRMGYYKEGMVLYTKIWID